MLNMYVTKLKVNFHFYYFSKVAKKSLDGADDLKGRFDTLKSLLTGIDYFLDCKTFSIGCSEIYNKLTTDTSFEYTFKEIEKFVPELDDSDKTTNAVIALVPLRQYFDFISKDKTEIRDKLFESNIRDFKGKSFVNNNINDT